MARASLASVALATDKAAGVRFGVREMIVIMIGAVEMEMTCAHDELNYQRGERKTRPPSLAQPEPAHRDAPRQETPAARREA